TADRNRSHWSTSKTPSYTKSVSWQHYQRPFKLRLSIITGDRPVLVLRIIQLEAVQEEMANEFRDLLVEKFKDSKVETFIGTFTA
ncbi:DUF2303 family protein, partial [Escherichia coli]|uniref:DUF2303 family protein n=1 Tax=Escherichia coli TaxID=562 RepID=UPI001FCEA344